MPANNYHHYCYLMSLVPHPNKWSRSYTKRDQWSYNQTMYLYVRALDVNGTSGRTLALTYFVGLFIIGNTIMLALFTALLLKSHDSDLEKLELSIKDKAESHVR